MKKLAFVSLLLAGGLALSMPAGAQQKKKAAPAKAKPSAKLEPGFKMLHALQYKIVKDEPGKTAEVGDLVDFHILIKCDTFVLGDSRTQQQGKPAEIPFQEPHNSTDWQWIFAKMSAGDSAVIYVACDSIIKTIPAENKQPLPTWLKKGNKIVINLAVVSITPKEEAEKKRAEMRKEQEEKAKEALANEGKNFDEYFAKNNIKPTKTASGLYYTISKEGSGPAIEKGQKVTMKYIGKLLDGSVFDANVEPDFSIKSGREPFTFTIGNHQVIQGWDEGVALLKKGSRATLYIPSGMAYGPQGRPGIPANSILVFDVEVVDVAAK